MPNQTLQDGLDVLTALNKCQRESVQQSPALLQLQRSDPQAFSRTSVSITAAYGEEDGDTEWSIDASDSKYVHIELYELRFIGPPFSRHSRHRVLGLMVTQELAAALLGELVAKLSPVECGEGRG